MRFRQVPHNPEIADSSPAHDTFNGLQNPMTEAKLSIAVLWPNLP